MFRKTLRTLNEIPSPLGDKILLFVRILIICIGIGMSMNAYVRIQHDGMMPISSRPAETLFWNEEQHFLADNGIAPFFGDWIWIPSENWSITQSENLVQATNIIDIPLGQNVLVSPGDIFMWLPLVTSISLIVPLLLITFAHAIRTLRQ